jgi:hypothetical protein
LEMVRWLTLHILVREFVSNHSALGLVERDLLQLDASSVVAATQITEFHRCIVALG